MAYQFNGSILNFAGVTFGITSFSEDGGSRPEIDVTTSADTKRVSLAGMPSTSTLSFGFIYQGERTSLISKLAGCTADSLTFSVVNNCAASNVVSDSLYYLMNYNIAGDLDGSIVGSLDLMYAP